MKGVGRTRRFMLSLYCRKAPSAHHGPAHHGPAQYGPAQYGPAQYGPAQYGPALCELWKHRHHAAVIARAHAGRGTQQPVADRIPALAFRHILHQDLLATRSIERAQIGVEVAAV